MLFADRREAAKQLAPLLSDFQNKKDVVVMAVPRGGVVLGLEVAQFLGVPLDLLVPRKIGHPQNPEYAICAVTGAGDLVCSSEGQQIVDTPQVKQIIQAEKKEAQRRLRLFLGARKPQTVEKKTVIVVDDGMATGLTMRAGVAELKRRGGQGNNCGGACGFTQQCC